MSTLPDFTGPGFFAGEAPDGLTTIAGTPTSASVRVYWRDPADPDAPDVLVAQTTSAPDGTWRITGLNPDLSYVVRAQKSNFNDATVVGAQPSRADVITYVDYLEPTEDFDGLTGYVLLDSGLPPFTCEVIQPLPYGLEPVLDGRKLLIDGTSDDEGIWNSVVRVTASNGVWVDVPVQAVIGLKAPDITVRYAAAGDWTITLQLAGGSEFADGLRVYRSTEPLDLEALPEPVAELDADADQWVDADVEPGQTYYYAVGAYVGGVVAMSPVVEREAVWTPADLTVAAKLWLDDESSLTNVSGRCSQWDDRSGNGYNFSQTNATQQPAVVESALNGRRVLRFDGTDDSLRGPSGILNIFRNVGAGWLFTVCKKATIDATGRERLVLYTNSSAFPNRFSFALGNVSQANKPMLATRRVDSTSTAALYASADGVTDWGIYCVNMEWSTGAGSIWINGSNAASSPSLTTAGVTSNTPSSAVTINGDAGGYSDIDLSTIIIGADTLPTAEERSRLEGWAAHRYGLTDNLPADHPYKEVAP